MSDEDDTKRETPSGSSTGWRIAAGIAVLAALIALGVLGFLLLATSSGDPADDVRACIIDPASRDFTGSGKATPKNCPPKGSTRIDGLVQKTNKTGFKLREIRDGRYLDTISLYVRKPDRPYIDVAHAQTHAALGQPVRVYTKMVDGRRAVVFMEDMPLLLQ